MRELGLIGGMSFEGTTIYYRKINEAVRARPGALHSANMLMHCKRCSEVTFLMMS
jgi:aspartate racemase